MVHYDRRVIARLLHVAASNGIPVQPGIYQEFGYDGVAIMRSGIPTAVLAVSTRFTHSPFEMGDIRDVEATLALLKAFVTAPAEPLPAGAY